MCCHLDAEGTTELVSQYELPCFQLSGSFTEFCHYVPVYQEQLPQLQVVTGQKFTFLDSAEGSVTQLVTAAHLLTLMCVERVHLLQHHH